MLGLFNSVMIGVGIIVAPRLFIVSAEISRKVGFAGRLLDPYWAIFTPLLPDSGRRRAIPTRS